MEFCDFPFSNVIIPTDFHIFQRGSNHPTGYLWDLMEYFMGVFHGYNRRINGDT